MVDYERKCPIMECLKMQVVYHNGEAVKVPCGKCGFCLTNKRSEWMFRIHHEMRAQLYPGWFLTLTYDEKHVKRTKEGKLSLRFRDVQKLLKQVRKKKYYAKYICVGEYGADTHRPHYHMLIWTDCPLDRLEKIWFRGRIHFGRLTMASAMYTLKYIIQPKQKEVDGIERTRAQFSKGLGLGYLTTQVYDYHTSDYDDPNLFSYIDGRKVALPRYYRKKIFTKYQMKVYAQKAKKDARLKHRKYMRELIAQGVVGASKYIEEIRSEQARRIIKKTKYNQSL